jgi:hypothetical protein
MSANIPEGYTYQLCARLDFNGETQVVHFSRPLEAELRVKSAGPRSSAARAILVRGEFAVGRGAPIFLIRSLVAIRPPAINGDNGGSLAVPKAGKYVPEREEAWNLNDRPRMTIHPG